MPCRQVNAESHSDNRTSLLKIINLIQVLLFLGHVGFALLRSHLLSTTSARRRNDSHLQVARPAPNLQGRKGNPFNLSNHLSSYPQLSRPAQIYQLARDTVVLLLESNPDMGQLLEWVIDRCYTSTPREADACFLALASIFSAK